MKNNDFDSFLRGGDIDPPNELDNIIYTNVKKDLDPSHQGIFLKMLLIHPFLAILTLLFCPQFNFSLTGNFEFFHYIHLNFGNTACNLVCGAVFMGPTAIFSTYLLSMSELRKIKKVTFLYFIALGTLSLSFFIFLGMDVFLTTAVYWIIGATGSGVLLHYLNQFIRFKWGPLKGLPIMLK